MTCIANYPTKKAFRAAVETAGPERCRIEDPSIFAPYSGPLIQYLKDNGSAVVTNHPKRSWYAKVSLMQDGSVRVR